AERRLEDGAHREEGLVPRGDLVHARDRETSPRRSAVAGRERRPRLREDERLGARPGAEGEDGELVAPELGLELVEEEAALVARVGGERVDEVSRPALGRAVRVDRAPLAVGRREPLDGAREAVAGDALRRAGREVVVAQP